MKIKTKIKDDFENQSILEKPLAIISHSGKKYDSGHYIASIRNEKNKYIQFNDDCKQTIIKPFENINYDVTLLLCKRK